MHDPLLVPSPLNNRVCKSFETIKIGHISPLWGYLHTLPTPDVLYITMMYERIFIEKEDLQRRPF